MLTEYPCEDPPPLTMVVCPLGDGCLGDGPACFAAAEALREEYRRALHEFAFEY